MIDFLHYMGKVVTITRPIEVVIGNIQRRVLYIIRQECTVYLERKNTQKNSEIEIKKINKLSQNSINNTDTNYICTPETDSIDISLSLMKLFDTKQELDFSIYFSIIRENVEIEMNEISTEQETLKNNIDDQALMHIYANEVFLTYGYSKILVSFLRKTLQANRKILVYVCEGYNRKIGHLMAKELAKCGIDTILVPDAALYVLMPSISKVLIGTHAVLADGGQITYSGGFSLCVAAFTYAKPVVVLTGLHKLTPQYAYSQDTFNEYYIPSDILSYNQVREGRITIINPGFDYIPPKYVSLFITNFGTYKPSYIYRLLSEYYNIRDHHFVDTSQPSTVADYISVCDNSY